jgi:tRNA modification GTPase
LGFERALVSNIAGTTRDLVESELFYNNTSFSLSDSAGLRETKDEIESRGINLTLEQIDTADVVVGIFDSSDKEVINGFSDLVKNKKYITVYNKLDLGVPASGIFDCMVSAKTGEGFDGLKDILADAFKVHENSDYTYLVRDRHISLFKSSLENLGKAFLKIQNVEDLELVAEDLKLARQSLDDVVGIKTSDSLLGDIFSNFCIGK